jgi:hypothetical protein
MDSPAVIPWTQQHQLNWIIQLVTITLKKRHLTIFQMTVPGEGHEDVDTVRSAMVRMQAAISFPVVASGRNELTE